MSRRPRTVEPIRDATVRSVANAIFAELYRLNHPRDKTWEEVQEWAGELLDSFLKDHSRLPTVEEVTTMVQATMGVTGT